MCVVVIVKYHWVVHSLSWKAYMKKIICHFYSFQLNLLVSGYEFSPCIYNYFAWHKSVRDGTGFPSFASVHWNKSLSYKVHSGSEENCFKFIYWILFFVFIFGSQTHLLQLLISGTVPVSWFMFLKCSACFDFWGNMEGMVYKRCYCEYACICIAMLIYRIWVD